MSQQSPSRAPSPIEAIRSWLAGRETPQDSVDHYQANCVVPRPTPSRPNRNQLEAHQWLDDPQPQALAGQLGPSWPDLHLRRRPGCVSPRRPGLELDQLLGWLHEFLRQLRNRQTILETLVQLCSPLAGRPVLARFHVQETISLVSSSLTLDVGLDVRLNQPASCQIDGRRHSLHDCVRIILVHLFCYSQIQLIAPQSQYLTCLMLAYVVDLMHDSGAPRHQIQLFVQDSVAATTTTLDHSQAMPEELAHEEQPANCHRSDDNNNNNIQHDLPTTSGSACNKNQEQQIYICLSDSDVYQAPIIILESYLRLPTCPNAIVLIEEAIYQVFTENWQRNFSRIVQASRDLKLLEISLDLNSIDVSVARRTSGHCINMIKFRSINELCKLMQPLRSISHIQLWTNNYLLAHELCLSGRYLKRCREFWLNHLPVSLAGRRFAHQLMDHCQETLRNELMHESYSELYHEYEHQIDQLRKQQVAFQRKYSNQKRCQLIMLAYLSLINKCKSMKQAGVGVGESVQRMKRFQLNVINNLKELDDASRIETSVRPIGLAILALDSKACIKSKSVIMEFVFKNLIIGNAVLLICPQHLLGLRFPINLMAKLPFQLIETKPSIEATFIEQSIQSSTPNCSLLVAQHPADLLHQSMNVTTASTTSQLERQQQFFQSSCLSFTCSADSGLQNSPLTTSCIETRKLTRCPKGVYVINLVHRYQSAEMTSEIVETLVMCLGCKRRSLWSPDGPLHCARFLINESLDQEQASNSSLWSVEP